MSFCDHIRACNNYYPGRAVPFLAGNDRIGLLRRDNAAALRRFPDVFAVENDKVRFLGRGDVEKASRAVDTVVDAGPENCSKWRNETFDVAPRKVRRRSFAWIAVQSCSSGHAPTVSISTATVGRDTFSLWVGGARPTRSGAR
jgi:hypothetical protein